MNSLILSKKLNKANFSLFVAFSFFIFLISCSSQRSAHNSVEVSKAKTVVLFVPGFKGTTLVDERGKTVWATPWEATFGDRSLALPTRNLGLPQAEKLFPKEVLKQIVIIPWIYEFDTYKKFLNNLRDKLPESARIEEFPYDWRFSSASNSILLDSKIDELRSKGAQRVILVGHSLGGTLVSYFLRYGKQSIDSAVSDWSGTRKVEGAVIVAAPFKGALNIFCDLQAGDRTAFNSSLLSRESEGTMESTYELLPNTKTDFDFWSKNRLGILRDELSSELRLTREEFVKSRLRNSNRFRELMFAPVNEQQKLKIPFFQFIGKGYPANESALIDEQTRECYGRTLSDGDGTVTIDSATLPEGFLSTLSPTVKMLEGKHAEILLDEAVFRSILSLANTH